MNVPAHKAILKKYPAGNVYQWFGENVPLYLAATGIEGHNGIDIAMAEGTPILAALAGVVFQVKDDPTGYGKHVQLVSDKLEDGTFISTIYGHCDDIIVTPGARVVAGQRLAGMSNTGFVISGGNAYWGNAPAGKGVHLHFGVRVFTDPVAGEYQYSAGGLSFGFPAHADKMHGWVDPMLYYLLTFMEYILYAGNQYLIYRPYKIAISIADLDELQKVLSRGLSGLPNENSDINLSEYWVIPGIETKRLRDIFNL